MSDNTPRRSKLPEAPETPTGYRFTRRGGKGLKAAKKAERRHKLAESVSRTRMRVRNVLIVIVQAFMTVLITAIVLLLIASGVNTFVRWNAQRLAEDAGTTVERQQMSRENVLIVGVEGDNAVGFLAMRVDPRGQRAFGIAIPDGAFLEVPGAGFSRIGESWATSPTVTASAISNYLTVPFDSWVAVPASVYRDALTGQNVSGLLASVDDSNLKRDELAALKSRLGKVPQKEVALVPLPVKPIKLGDQTYFEPQRAEVADLLESWWGVDPSEAADVVKIIVYNGAGVPGVAGEAAQQLIRAGFRVVDTKNADAFDYANTIVVVKQGERSRGEQVAKVLGATDIRMEISDQGVANVIVIVGKDYKPQESGE